MSQRKPPALTKPHSNPKDHRDKEAASRGKTWPKEQSPLNRRARRTAADELTGERLARLGKKVDRYHSHIAAMREAAEEARK